MSLGERIRELRKRDGLTQAKLAQKIPTSKNNISKYELNITVPNPDTLRMLALIFGTTADYLIGIPGAPISVKVQTSPTFSELMKVTENFSEKKIEKLLDYAVLLQNSMKDE